MRKSLRRKAVTSCKVGAILITAGFAIVATLTYNSYNSFARVIDQQIAGGYLRGHAGLYAAPRVIEKDALLSREQLVTSLQRAGYARDRVSNIWSGSFQVSEDRKTVQKKISLIVQPLSRCSSQTILITP